MSDRGCESYTFVDASSIEELIEMEVSGIVQKEDYFYYLKTEGGSYLIMNSTPGSRQFIYRINDLMLGKKMTGVIDESSESKNAFELITSFRGKFRHLDLCGNVHLKAD